MIKQIPNLLTLSNLFCGITAIICLLSPQFPMQWVPFLLVGAAIADFLDGFAARGLGVSGALGKELDSLADLVSFGVVPGLMLFTLFNQAPSHPYLPFIGLILSLAAAYRLAKFNIDTRQSDGFLGLATPACTLLVLSLFMLGMDLPDTRWGYMLDVLPEFQAWIAHPIFLVITTFILSFLMISEIPMPALKKLPRSTAGKTYLFSFLTGCLILIFQFDYFGLALGLIGYILQSIIQSIKS